MSPLGAVSGERVSSIKQKAERRKEKAEMRKRGSEVGNSLIRTFALY